MLKRFARSGTTRSPESQARIGLRRALGAGEHDLDAVDRLGAGDEVAGLDRRRRYYVFDVVERSHVAQVNSDAELVHAGKRAGRAGSCRLGRSD